VSHSQPQLEIDMETIPDIKIGNGPVSPLPTGQIDIAKIQGLLNQPTPRPPLLKPIQETDESGSDVIREKMEQIKNKLGQND